MNQGFDYNNKNDKHIIYKGELKLHVLVKTKENDQEINYLHIDILL